MTKKIVVLQGSKSDEPIGSVVGEILKSYDIDFDRLVLSAHRDPEKLEQFCRSANEKYALVIAIAGLSAALPGAVAARTKIPVIGVPVDTGPLRGIDALLSIAQMPSGIPVAAMGIGVAGAKNAGHLAARILRIEENPF
ncbi:AIR carboxylase family protein [bacterium]|nr:AIR carboxylase family protein [bacterium]